MPEEEVSEKLEQRLTEIAPHFDEDTQTELGLMFDVLIDMTDDDLALAGLL